MSVIGLMVSLTQRLTRSRSRHAVCDITMSRGCDAPPWQSPGFSAQNATQPIRAPPGLPPPRGAGVWRPPGPIAGIFGTEFDPADRRARDVAQARIKHSFVT